MNVSDKLREMVDGFDILSSKRVAPEDVTALILLHGKDIAAALEEWDLMRPQRNGDAPRKLHEPQGLNLAQRARRLGFGDQ